MKKYLPLLLAASLFSAQAASPNLIGKCGASLNFMRKGAAIEDGKALSGIGVIDFDKKTAAGSLITYDSGKPKKSTLVNLQWSFEIKTGYLDGAFLLVPSDPDKPTLQILPVNSGNSYLFQIIDTDSIGICQKL